MRDRFYERHLIVVARLYHHFNMFHVLSIKIDI